MDTPTTDTIPPVEAAEAPPVTIAPARRSIGGWITRTVPLALAIVALVVGGAMLVNAAPPLPSLSNATSTPGALEVGTPAPNFSLQAADGKMVSLSDYHGKAVVLNFWATWCPPCRSEMPDMQQLSDERGSDMVVLAVNMQEAADPINTFTTKYGLSFPVLMDVTGQVSQAYRVASLPTSFFIDKDGNLASYNVGALNRSAMARRVDQALQLQP